MFGRIFGVYVLKLRTKRKIVRDFISLSQEMTQKRRLIEHLESHAPARARDLKSIDVSAATIARAVNSGDVLRLGRGLYTLPYVDLDTNENLIEIAKRAPKTVVCLTSVLAFHGLTDQIPRRIWIAIGAKDWKPKINYPRIRTVRFREPYFSKGVEEHRLRGATVRMYTIPKSLADAFRNQRLVNRSVAIEALKSVVEQRKANPAEITEAARQFGAWNQMRPYIEAVVSNG